MSMSATAQPSNVPPRVRIDVGTGTAGAPFTSLTVYRDGLPIRTQPFVGGDAAVAFDYESPFGKPVTYTATGTYVPVGTPVWIENWANTSSWTAAGGSWSVSSGKAQITTNAANLTRTTGGTIQKVKVLTPEYGWVSLLDASDNVLVTLQTITSFAVSKIVAGAYQQTAGSLSAGSYELVVANSVATARATDGSWSISVPVSGTPTKVRLTAATNGVQTAKFGQVTTTLVQAPADFTGTATATLSVDKAWLIHPSKPTLSQPIDAGPGRDSQANVFIEAGSGGSKTSAAVSTIHRPVGRRKAVVFTSGPRQADEWTLTIGSPTFAAKNALRALVDDQTPLLLRLPVDAGFDWDLPEDWYSVGDVTVNRVESPAVTSETVMTLPLIPVDEPVVRQAAIWTWADLMTNYATWADVLAAYDTWLDVLAGPAE